jgi:hypothetical protein
MAAVCEGCGAETNQYTMRFFSGRAHYECRVCSHPRHRASQCVNPYENLVLEHVHDEFGKPVRVTSRRQLQQAEKRYNFRSVVGNYLEENFDKPPQQRKMSPIDEVTTAGRAGKKDAKGNRIGWMYPEVAEKMLAEVRAKNIDINKW